jgi:hypothetical protein
MSYLLLILIILSPAFAALDKIQIKNLNLNYSLPQGSGDVEKVSVGISLQKQSYPIEVRREENSFDVFSQFVDFQWMNPIPFFHNIQKGSTKGLNLKVDRLNHFLTGVDLRFTGENSGEFVFKKFDLNCQGSSLEVLPVDRLKTDCLEKMQATISNMELPFEFLNTIASQLPDIPTETDGDMPANDFALNIKEGNFFSYLRIKYVVRAYLKFWGQVQYEDEGRVLAIRMDQIKYGVLPVTTLVMNELRRQIKHPNVSVTPPWIRIKLENK